MSITYEPRAGDARALVVSLGLGAFIGLAIGGAYIVGGVAREAVSKPLLAQANRIQTPQPDLTGANPVSILGQAPQLAMGAGGSKTQPVSLRDRFSLALALTRSVVQPFHFKTAPADVGDPSRDTQCLAQAVYYEARGESASGQAAVAQVVLNRVRHPSFPKTICGVVFQHAGSDCQFSFACNGAMHQPLDQAAWRRATSVAERALSGAVMAEVGAATHFQAARTGNDWAGGLARVAQIGEHIFYRFSGRAGTSRMFHGQAQRSGPEIDAAATHIDADDGRVHTVLTVATAGSTTESRAEVGPATSPATETKASLSASSPTPSSQTPKASEPSLKAAASSAATSTAPGEATSSPQPLKASDPEKAKPVAASATQS